MMARPQRYLRMPGSRRKLEALKPLTNSTCANANGT